MKLEPFYVMNSLRSFEASRSAYWPSPRVSSQCPPLCPSNPARSRCTLLPTYALLATEELKAARGAQDADELPLVREESEAIAAAAVADAGLGRRAYVLRPIDGRLRYTRRGRDARADESQAAQDADVELDALSLHLASAARGRCLDCQNGTLLSCC